VPEAAHQGELRLLFTLRYPPLLFEGDDARLLAAEPFDSAQQHTHGTQATVGAGQLYTGPRVPLPSLLGLAGDSRGWAPMAAVQARPFRLRPL
jgi:hypothetical protein